MTRTIRAIATAALLLAACAAPAGAAPATPTLTTVASSAAGAGLLSATATLADGAAPTGTITFRLYGPGDAACAQAPVFTSTVGVAGNAAYQSAGFEPASAGTHRWVASYDGDAGNSAVQSACGASGTLAGVAALQRALTLTPSPSAPAGRPVHAVATVGPRGSGCLARLQGWGCVRRPSPPHFTGADAGTITFRLYGPDDATCSRAPAFTDVVAVTGAITGGHRSSDLVPQLVGAYRWTAAFSGETAEDPGTAACGRGSGTQVTVTRAVPALAVSSAPAVLGGAIHATAALTDAVAGSELVFALHGPGDERCAGPPVFSSSVATGGGGSYDSEPFRPAVAGVYRWVASRAGDANSEPVATRCDDAGAAVVVSPPPPASPPADDPGTPPPATRPAREPAIARFALATRCVRPAANGRVGVTLRLTTAQAGAVRVEVERALGTKGRNRCPAPHGGGRFTGRYRTVATMREVRTHAAAAALARRLTLRLRLQPALYRITVRAYASGGRLSAPKRRFLRVLAQR